MRRLGSMMRWGWHLTLAIAIGLTGAVSITGAFALSWHYAAPARITTSPLRALHPIIENGWIKVPFNIVRDRECLAKSTLTLRRSYDYGQPLGVREDVVILGLYNTTITGIGTTPVMLWFRQPPDLGSGIWAYEGKTQDDCGGIGDWLNFSARQPRNAIVPGVLVIPDGVP